MDDCRTKRVAVSWLLTKLVYFVEHIRFVLHLKWYNLFRFRIGAMHISTLVLIGKSLKNMLRHSMFSSSLVVTARLGRKGPFWQAMAA